MLWREGAVNLSQSHESLGKPIGYTTIQTRLNRMVAKGVVKKSNDRPALYSAGVTREQVNRHDLELLVKKVNNGKFIPLISHLVNDRSLTQEEIDELKSLIADAEKKSSESNKRGRK
jgi:predicted transcriptional regulator